LFPEVVPANQSDLMALLAGEKPGSPDAPPFIPAMTDPQSYQRYWLPMRRELRGHQSSLAAVPIAQLRLLAPDRPTQVTVQGVVTLVSPILVVQDSTGGVAVLHPEMTKPVQIGDDVEVSGDADLSDFSPVLRGAAVKALWSHAAVPPVAVTAVQASTGAFDARFIETEGRLESEQHTGDGRVTFQLNEGSQSFLAIAEKPSPAETPLGFKIGSRLRLRGICVTDAAYTKDEIPFALLMRSVEDAQVIEPPPWWGTEHIVELGAGLLLFSLGLQAVYSSVKRSQLRAVIEERERLAMEMHDTLAQSFVGLGFQLETLCSEAQPGTAMRAQLETTVDLVRFGHMEARRNIAALRPGNLEQLGLEGALEQAAQTIVQGGPIAVSLTVRGEPRPVPLRIADALFRIGQEAVANSARHAKAHRIHLRLAYGKNSLKLSVKDDGVGFFTAAESDGFGIRGLKRRASAIGADLRIRSIPGHGTSVSVRAILPKPMLSSWWKEISRRTGWREWFHGETV
jgi:signal transduction histidine kinase